MLGPPSVDVAQSGPRARTLWSNAARADDVGACQRFGKASRNLERAAIYEAAEAVCEAHFGSRAAARERARAALALGEGRDVECAAGFALALAGGYCGISEAGRRALALSGEKAKARTAYQDFLRLWSEANPELPILMQAKAEFATLP